MRPRPARPAVTGRHLRQLLISLIENIHLGRNKVIIGLIGGIGVAGKVGDRPLRDADSFGVVQVTRHSTGRRDRADEP